MCAFAFPHLGPQSIVASLYAWGKLQSASLRCAVPVDNCTAGVDERFSGGWERDSWKRRLVTFVHINSRKVGGVGRAAYRIGKFAPVFKGGRKERNLFNENSYLTLSFRVCVCVGGGEGS